MGTSLYYFRLEDQSPEHYLWLANYYFAHDSSGFSVLLRFCDAQCGRSFHPPHRCSGPVARIWRRPFHSCGVASPQAPTPDRESLPATIAESIRVGPRPCPPPPRLARIFIPVTRMSQDHTDFPRFEYAFSP